MKANELRIGNYINANNRHIKLCGFVGFYATYTPLDESSHGFAVEVSKLKPIQLTEEWLLKFGFEKWTWCDDCAIIPLYFGEHLYCRYYNEKWHIQTMKVGRDKKGLYGKTQGRTIIPNGRIKYVHQLQNLYFALTGNELEIK